MATLWTALQGLRQDFRRLRRSPAFTFTAILTLALGVTANVVVFGVLNGLLLKPLPIQEPAQVYFIQHPEAGDTTLSFPQYRDLREQGRAFSQVAAFRMLPISLMAQGKAEQSWAYEATGSYFDLLGVKPYLGRFYRASDDTHGANGSPYAVLTYQTWKNEFGADRTIVGRAVSISKHPFTVVGVAPPGFNGTERFLQPALWVDLWNEQQIEGYNYLNDRGDSGTWVLARTKGGVTRQQAQQELNGLATHLAAEYPKTDAKTTFLLTRPGFIGNYFRAPLEAFLAAMMLMAGLVLAAACANLGGLYAARALERTREFAIRLALGSSRANIARSVLFESLVIALAGGGLGCLLGALALHAITAYHPPFNFPIAVAVDPGPHVYLFALLLSLAAALLCSLIPIREASRADGQQAMRSASGWGSGARRRWTLRDLLLVTEVALCCVLVTASFVSLSGLERSLDLPLGFKPGHVTLATYFLGTAGYGDDASLAFNRKVKDKAERIPEVVSAAFSSGTPLNVVGQNGTTVYPPSTVDFSPANRGLHTDWLSVSPDYFRTAGTRVLAGREFTWADDAKAPRVAIVNATFARMVIGRKNAVGASFPGYDHKPFRIVGIAEDGKYQSLNESPQPELFYAASQRPNGNTQLLVRTREPATADPARIAGAISDILHKQDPSVPLGDIQPWTQALAPVLFPARAATIALGVLGGFALLLAVTGIFGLASYSVTRRMREFGIRVALGASRVEVLRAALGRVARMVLLGSCVGLALGVASARVLAAVVYGASVSDPLVLGAVALTMALVGLLSAAVPARRALAVDPVILLREE